MFAFFIACAGADSAHSEEPETTTTAAICGDVAVDSWSAGMSKPGSAGLYQFAIVAADPAPPDKGNNSWTLAVTDAGGAPVTDATVIVTPFMPEHNHGTNPETVATTASDGQYLTEPFNLFMGGVWELTLSAAGSLGSDAAVFSFCIEG